MNQQKKLKYKKKNKRKNFPGVVLKSVLRNNLRIIIIMKIVRIDFLLLHRLFILRELIVRMKLVYLRQLIPKFRNKKKGPLNRFCLKKISLKRDIMKESLAIWRKVVGSKTQTNVIQWKRKRESEMKMVIIARLRKKRKLFIVMNSKK